MFEYLQLLTKYVPKSKTTFYLDAGTIASIRLAAGVPPTWGPAGDLQEQNVPDALDSDTDEIPAEELNTAVV